MGETGHDEGLLKLEARAMGAGVVGGFLAGIAMGLLLHLTTDMIAVLGSFAGEEGALRGWFVHMGISLGYGVVFAFVVAYPPIADFTASFGLLEWVLAAITYAVMVGAVSLAVLPFVFELPWQSGSGTPFVSGGPGITTILPGAAFAVAHLVFGAILGGVYAVLDDRT